MGCFYDKGLSFECQGCSYCCSAEPGFVFLSASDIDNMACFLSIDRDSFINTYCRKVGQSGCYQISLLEKENYDCIFLNKGLCTVYNVRPVQCRTYPFWKNIMTDRHAWENESQYCPGINKGRIHSKAEIESALKDNNSNTPLLVTEKFNA